MPALLRDPAAPSRPRGYADLSHQIEHHVFPDLPSNRYREIAGPVRELFERHGLPCNSRPLPRQVASAWHKVLRLSLPPRG